MTTKRDNDGAGQPPARRKRPSQAASARKLSAATIRLKERDAEACSRKLRGENHTEIAAAMGYRDASGARKAIERGLAGIGRADREALADVEEARLDEALKDAFRVRKWAIDSQDGELLLKSVLAMVRVSESRRKLFGTDAPMRSEVSGSGDIAVMFHQALAPMVVEQDTRQIDR